MQLEKRYQEIKSLGGEVIAISSDPPPTVRGTVKGWKLSFPLLPDPQKKIIRLYGTYNSNNGLAHPLTMILDKDGKVRWVFRAESYLKRPPAKDVLRELQKAAGPVS